MWQWETVEWIVPRLPDEYAMYTDKLTSAILETGVVSAINYTISITEAKSARPMFRVAAVSAVCKGHIEAAKYLCTRFMDSTIRKSVVLTVCPEGNTSLIKWCADTMHSLPEESTRALLYRGNIHALNGLKTKGKVSGTSVQLVLYAALGGHAEALEWVLDSNPGTRFSTEEMCLMVCTKGLLGTFQHLVVRRGFGYNTSDYVRFAKKGSGIARWFIGRGDDLSPR